jgi:hypothetical protein
MIRIHHINNYHAINEIFLSKDAILVYFYVWYYQ